jgi:hypothetical protein
MLDQVIRPRPGDPGTGPRGYQLADVAGALAGLAAPGAPERQGA